MKMFMTAMGVVTKFISGVCNYENIRLIQNQNESSLYEIIRDLKLLI